MEGYKDQIASMLIGLNHGFNGNLPNIIREIDNACQWAWDNWDEDIIATYYEGDKPSLPTEQFIYQWVENEDFEADGFDVEYLKEVCDAE